MSGKRFGPRVRLDLSCFGCQFERSESYRAQGDSGHDVYCDHEQAPKPAHVGDTNWETPLWCPLRNGAIGAVIAKYNTTADI